MTNLISGISGLLFRQKVASNVLASVPWVAQWKFNNDGQDSIGSNHLTNNNSATFTTGKLGGATGATQLVAASGQYWSVADNAALSMGDVDFTVACWVYLDSSGGARAVISRDDMGANREYSLYLDSANLFFHTFTSGIVSASTFGSLPLGEWICVVTWRQAGVGVSIQINNGTIDSSANASTHVGKTVSQCIGGAANGFQFFDGRIDNVCIAKSAAGGGGVLTAEQRTAFYNAGVGTEVLG